MDKNILLQIENEFRKEVHILDRVEILRELALEQIETGLITNEILKRIRVCVTDNILSNHCYIDLETSYLF